MLAHFYMKTRLLRVYRKLLKQFSSQENWWPQESSYEVMVGAVLVQNTNWNNVKKAIANLKKEKKLNERSILEMKSEELETLIRSSGYYKQKAKRLKRVTEKWVELTTNGSAHELPIEEVRSQLLEVNGIGKETADSILLYALNRPIFMIDAYTRRFCKAHFDIEYRGYDEYRLLFETHLPKDVKFYQEYHALIVTWGQHERKVL